VRTARQTLSVLLLGLLVVTLAACTGATPTTILPTPTPVQRRPASASPHPGASPAAILPNPFARKPEAAASPETVASALRLPSDGQQIVVVDSTDGHGVWVRRTPAGEPIRTWPDGSPMLVIGEDDYAEGRTWRHVATLDGDTGWAAADFLLMADAAMLAANPPNLHALMAPPSTTRTPDAVALQPRVAVAEAPPAVQIVVAMTATPRPVTRAAPKPQAAPAAAVVQPAAPAAAAAPPANAAMATPAPTATPQPSATPIKAPQGATTLEVAETTLAVVGSARGLPIQIGNRPRTGMELLAVMVKVVNTADTPYALYRGSFKLALSDRTRVEPLAGGDTPMPYSVAVEPDGELEATLTFEVPVGTRVDGLIWAPERDVTYSIGI
jgi:hypothetical protein